MFYLPGVPEMTREQSPLGSGFGPTTTARDMLAGVDLRGRIAIVTGGYSGLGLETTKALVHAGATVIVPARTPQKARTALAGSRNIELADLDLLDPQSISAFAKGFVDTGRPLDILVNSAGVMAAPLMRDARGYESQFSSNHLGHFQLTAQLLPALRRSGDARVVSVASRGHRFGGVRFDDPHFEACEYDKWKAYGQSKTANILFALALDQRGEAHGIRSFSVHPGRILDTDLIRHLTPEDLRAAGLLDEQGQLKHDPSVKTPEQGAATGVWCAASPQLNGKGGVYCEDVEIARAVAADSTADFGVRPWAIDVELAQRLWALSEELTVPFRI
jgi:NAD(P)-dependent dehydrogenase (short-subunit alcohol dehydrogenase family)